MSIYGLFESKWVHYWGADMLLLRPLRADSAAGKWVDRSEKATTPIQIKEIASTCHHPKQQSSSSGADTNN
jgi:hypothetical protein